MTHRSNAQQSPWHEWIDRDDRSWLDSLALKKWDTNFCQKSLHPLLEPIVTSLEFGSHSRWGLQAPKDELRALENNFLGWMKSSSEWTVLQQNWSEEEMGPWSLPLTLTRSYMRFHSKSWNAFAPKKSRPSPSPLQLYGTGYTHPGYEFGSEGLDQALSAPILEAFNVMVEEIPIGPVRLVYQLHLDGLINEEISELMGLQLDIVEAHLAEAKSHIELLVQERNFGT